MQKRQTRGGRVLCVESLGWAGGEFGVDQAVDGLRVRYSLQSDGDIELLDDVQWADWDRAGQLLVATRSGKLQVRSLDADRPDIVFERICLFSSRILPQHPCGPSAGNYQIVLGRSDLFELPWPDFTEVFELKYVPQRGVAIGWATERSKRSLKAFSTET